MEILLSSIMIVLYLIGFHCILGDQTMKAYLVRDFRHTLKITEADGQILTGHSDQIRVKGNSPNLTYYKDEWAASLPEAVELVKTQLTRVEWQVIDHEKSMIQERKRLEQMREAVAALVVPDFWEVFPSFKLS
jgi:hypothetical protein